VHLAGSLLVVRERGDGPTVGGRALPRGL